MNTCCNCKAIFYDGQTSLSQRVTLSIDGNHLQIAGHSQHQRYPLNTLRLSPPLGTMKRVLQCPDGCRCELDNCELCEVLEKTLRSNRVLGIIHRWENSIKLAGIALLLATLTVWLFISYSIPLLAKQATALIPTTIEVRTGEETLALLDHGLFHPSKTTIERQQQLTASFDKVLNKLGNERPYQLLFRSSPALGANAFALPGGTVIFTDDLVELAQSDQELIAIMAHEIGHIKGRHALRMVMQNTSAGFLVAALTGDLMSTTSLSAALPSVFVEAKFSRDMEREADRYAVHYLTEQQIPLHYFADILNRLQSHHMPGSHSDRLRNWTHYIESHPTTDERVSQLKLTGLAPQR